MAGLSVDSLTAPLTPQELQILEQCRGRGEFGPRGSLAWLPVLIFVVISVTVAASLLITTSNLHFTGASGRFLHFKLVFYAIPAVIVFTSATVLLRSRQRRKGWALLVRFAGTNGMQFGVCLADLNYSGLLFGKGRSRTPTHHPFSPTRALVDIGGCEYITGPGDDSTIHRWRFVALRLSHLVPYLLLDAKTNNDVRGTSLLETSASSQHISLGGPFDSHYQLHAPEGYGRDAFQLLPPSIMETLLNASTAYDIEMIDD